MKGRVVCLSYFVANPTMHALAVINKPLERGDRKGYHVAHFWGIMPYCYKIIIYQDVLGTIVPRQRMRGKEAFSNGTFYILLARSNRVGDNAILFLGQRHQIKIHKTSSKM